VGQLISVGHGAGAYGAVYFQFAEGSRHFYLAVSDKPRADVAIDSIRAGLVVFARSILKSSLEIVADWTAHNFPFQLSGQT
jgi:hypothetical protein